MAIINQRTLQIDITIRKYEVDHGVADPLDGKELKVELVEQTEKKSMSLNEAIKRLIDLLPNN